MQYAVKIKEDDDASFHCEREKKGGASFRENLHDIPFRNPLDILHDDLEPSKVNSSDGVKSNVEENERPLEEGVDRVC